MGVPGTGKTTISKKLIKLYHFVYLDNNFIADAFYSNTRTSEEYKNLRDCFYIALYRIVKENLLVGNSVLLDVPHVTHMKDHDWCARLRQFVLETHVTLKIVRCFCSEETLKKRLLERDEERDKWKLSHWEKFMKNEPLMIPIPFDHIDINTEYSLQDNLKKIKNYFHR